MFTFYFEPLAKSKCLFVFYLNWMYVFKLYVRFAGCYDHYAQFFLACMRIFVCNIIPWMQEIMTIWNPLLYCIFILTSLHLSPIQCNILKFNSRYIYFQCVFLIQSLPNWTKSGTKERKWNEIHNTRTRSATNLTKQSTLKKIM